MQASLMKDYWNQYHQDCKFPEIRTEGQNRILEQGLQVIDLLLRKNADYGCSAWETPVLTPWLDVDDAILVRMSDKLQRLRTLMSADEQHVKDESIRDTMRDLAGYAILYLAKPDGGEQGG